MLKPTCALVLAIGCLLGSSTVAAHSADQIRAIEQAYSQLHAGRLIPDNQLEYYLDRSDEGWSMSQISQDMDMSARTYTNNDWRPQSGWTTDEVVCSSIDSRYQECSAPFQGRAVITSQISQASCIEGQSWGQRPGTIWVKSGCRARFGIVSGGPNTHPMPMPQRTVSCQSRRGRYRECATGMSGRIQLSQRLPYSQSCVEGRSWGQRPGVVWVSRGCRALFRSVGRPGPRDDGNWNNNYSVTCSSTGGDQVRCAWDPRYGQPRIDQQLSQTACIEGRTWDYDNRNAIWVSGGCRARFVSSQTGGPQDHHGDGAPWVRDSNYSVTCISDSGRRSVCTWDNRYGSPRLIEQISTSACVEGRDWGYDSQGGLWVDAGCRARFGYR